MHPVLLSFPPIHTYGAMLLLAWGLGWCVARRHAKTVGIPAWHIDWLVPLFLVASALGSRLAGRLCQALTDESANDRMLFGAVLMSVCVGIIYGRAARLPLGRLADAFAVSLPLAISVLRIGCFSAGCCWGDLCVNPDRLAAIEDPAWAQQVQTIPALCPAGYPLSVRFPAGSPAYGQHLTAGLLPPGAQRSLPVHPVQLYEFAASLGLFGLLLAADKWLRHWGESFLLFTLGYAMIRFVIEWFRADNEALVFGLTFSQLACILAVLICAVTWRVRVLLAERNPRLRRSSTPCAPTP